jgi:hypothetical protein
MELESMRMDAQRKSWINCGYQAERTGVRGLNENHCGPQRAHLRQRRWDLGPIGTEVGPHPAARAAATVKSRGQIAAVSRARTA